MPAQPAMLKDIKEPIDLERADAIVTELVKSSLYGEGGRRKLYEAVLMVSTHFQYFLFAKQ
jgi:hypothetical protein